MVGTERFRIQYSAKCEPRGSAFNIVGTGVSNTAWEIEGSAFSGEEN